MGSICAVSARTPIFEAEFAGPFMSLWWSPARHSEALAIIKAAGDRKRRALCSSVLLSGAVVMTMLVAPSVYRRLRDAGLCTWRNR